MKIFAKLLVSKTCNPFAEIYGLRATIEVDYSAKIFYVKGETNQNSWGISFAFKPGYTADKPDVNGLSSGTKEGITYWVSARSRPATLDYFFDVRKNGIVTDTYRVVYII